MAGRSQVKFRVQWPDGRVTEHEGITKFIDEHSDMGLSGGCISGCLSGKSATHKGLRFFKIAAGHEPPPPLKDEPDEYDDGKYKPGPGPITAEARKAELQQCLAELSHQVRRAATGDWVPPTGWNPERILSVYRQEAAAYGLDLTKLADARSDEERLQEAVDAILTSPEEVFALVDEQIDTLEAAFEQVRQFGEDYFTARQRETTRPKELAEAWIARLRRIRALRKRAMEIRTETSRDAKLNNATRLLRYMIYTGRDDKGAVYSVGFHMVKMSVDLFMAQHGAVWDCEGMKLPGEQVGPAPMAGERDGRLINDGTKADGAVMMYPPRHTKTTVLRFWCGQTINEDPVTQGVYLHDKEDESKDFKQHVGNLFDPQTSSGRRSLSLYPQNRLADYDNNAYNLRVWTPDPPKNPNLHASSIWSSALGKNLNWIIADDVIPQEDQNQPTERDRRKRKFRGTWLTRFVGGKGFYILSGYPWHHDDLLWETYKLARKGVESNWTAGLRVLVSKMPVGGPKTNFKSIWPDMFPPQTLRAMYRKINDAAIWSANFMLNPITDDMKIVKKVRLYDVDEDEHQLFVQGAVIHVSVDPAATARVDSDKAGFILAGFGDAIFQERVGDLIKQSSETVIRILEAKEFYATQIELVDHIAELASGRKIDLVHVEVVQGFVAVLEMLSRVHGIQSVIEHKPGNKNKEQRLRAVASMLEDGSPGLRAVVEFPGRKNEHGVLEPLDGVRHLIDYVINFKVTTGHHSLDALTQLCKHLAPAVGIGEGSVSKEMRENAGLPANRLTRLYAEMERESREARRPESVLSQASGSVI